MIKIISGPTKNERKEFTCKQCGTVFQADKWDYEFWNPNLEWGYRIPCPTCGDKSWHKRLKKWDQKYMYPGINNDFLHYDTDDTYIMYNGKYIYEGVKDID